MTSVPLLVGMWRPMSRSTKPPPEITFRPTWGPSSLFFYDTATTEIYTLSLHDALPILDRDEARCLLVYRRPLRREEAAMLHLPRDVDREVGGIHPHPHVRVHVHHEQIEPAVAVVVEHLAPDRSVRRPAERLGGDVLEGAVAGVPIQLTPADHAGYEQVEEAVLLVVEHGHVSGPPATPQAGAV